VEAGQGLQAEAPSRVKMGTHEVRTMHKDRHWLSLPSQTKPLL